jgi:23S rRNA pseudouridine1911/1915/1917 synthase
MEKSGREKRILLTVETPDELLKFLYAKLPEKNRKSVKSLLTHGHISVGNLVITQFNHPLLPGQEVVIHAGKAPRDVGIKGLKIIYEDASLIVINKEAGLLSMGTEKEKVKTAYSLLNEYVKRKNQENRIFIVHRLDRDTSGIMMFAKSEKVQQELQNHWQEAVLERGYVVIVEGVVTQEEGTVTSWLKENKNLVMYSSSTPGEGQKAVTHYKLLKASKHYSLVEVKLETGRKNQIRVHMQDLGHSIMGDKKYGSTHNPLKRLGLHAYLLFFRHPLTQEVLRFEAEIPREFHLFFKEQQS